MRRCCSWLAVVASLAGCDIGKITVNTTSKVLARAQPCLQQESDYEMARRRSPARSRPSRASGSSTPSNERLIKILTEGYCQYGTAFVEDDWEVAKFARTSTPIEYHNDARDQHLHALPQLRAQDARQALAEGAVRATTEHGRRSCSTDDRPAASASPLMFAGLALGSIINHNLTRIEMIAYICRPSQAILRARRRDRRQEGPPADKAHAAHAVHRARHGPHRPRQVDRRRPGQGARDVRDGARGHRQQVPARRAR